MDSAQQIISNNMDSRDFNQEPNYPEGTYLEDIYRLQKELLDGYVKIEGLPPYPVNINTKANQTLIKDFTARVIEELAECYESLVNINSIMEESMGLSNSFELEQDVVMVANHLQNANEELADSLHFMIELLIYTNIQPEDVANFIRKWVEKHHLRETKDVLNVLDKKNDILQAAMELGYSMLFEYTPYMDLVLERNKLDIFKKVDAFAKEPEKLDKRLMYAGHKFNALTYISYKSVMWDVAYHLNIARNFLKNKPWKRSQMLTDEVKFQEEIALGFIMLCGLYKYMGIEESKDLYFIYFRKNLTNKFRQKSNY